MASKLIPPSLLIGFPIKRLKFAHKQFQFGLGEWTASSSSSNGDSDKQNLTRKEQKMSLKRDDGSKCYQFICVKAFPDVQEDSKERLYFEQLRQPQIPFVVQQCGPQNLDKAVIARLELESCAGLPETL